MIETTTHYHFSGEFSNLTLFADDDGDIMIEANGCSSILTQAEALEIADLLYMLAGGERVESYEPFEVPTPSPPVLSVEARLQRLLAANSISNY